MGFGGLGGVWPKEYLAQRALDTLVSGWRADLPFRVQTNEMRRDGDQAGAGAVLGTAPLNARFACYPVPPADKVHVPGSCGDQWQHHP